METREQLLSRYASLKEKARKLAAGNKHQLASITRIRTNGYSKCIACDASVWVKMFPPKSQPEISGTAITSTCRNPL